MKNKLIIVLFLLSTSFFLFQHWYAKGILWDFYSYELNGRHWFFKTKYYEPFRPPLMPFIIGMLGANSISEYVYIIFVSLIFAYSSIKLSQVIKVDKLTFYGLSLNVYLLVEGLFNGTELLSISLIELMLYFIIKNKEEVGGFFYSLSCLTRYNFFAYFILLFSNLRLKKALKGLIVAFLTFIPWLIYNKVVYGNFFMGIIDSYVMNYYYRTNVLNLNQIIEHFLYATNFLLPTFVIGLSKFKRDKRDLIFLLILIIGVVSYLSIPLKTARYLFPIILPMVYFSTKLRWKKEHIIIFFMFSLLFAFYSTPHSTLNSYKGIIQKIKETNCSLESNVWIYFNYLGYNVFPAVNHFDNDTLIIINNYSEYNKTALIGIKNRFNYSNFQIYSNKCKLKKMRYDLPYMYLKSKELNENKSLNPCDYVPLSMICKTINGG